MFIIIFKIKYNDMALQGSFKHHLPGFSVKYHTYRNRPRHHFLFNFLAFLLVITALSMISWGAKEMTTPIDSLQYEKITLDPLNLFSYSVRTILRMLIALIFSFIVTIIYASLAAKNRYAEQILIPVLDILQSVPILGYISFTVTAFIALFPGSIMGAELAAIFAIFTSQVWNMIFSFYQSLKTIPNDLNDTAYILKLSSWKKFWKMELPYGIPNLIWNILISMSNSWFFLVAAEVITVGNNKIALPGLGSYIALAITEQNTSAVIYAILTMSIVILLYDQFIMRPLAVFADKYYYDANINTTPPTSWVVNIFRQNMFINKLILPLKYLARFILNINILNIPTPAFTYVNESQPRNKIRWIDYSWYTLLICSGIIISYYIFHFLYYIIGLDELLLTFKLAFYTLLRVFILTFLVSLIWVPIGIYIGQNPKLAQIIQPLAQFLAAFPVNLLFPIFFAIITKYNLNPDIWLSPLMIIGAQWYILFNIIAGSLNFPSELGEAVKKMNVKGTLWWRKIMLPAILPFFLTGAITASGGAWNASILAEIINYGNQQLKTVGLGSYISLMTRNADFPRIALGVGVMALVVVLFNRFFWQPLYIYSTKKFHI